MNTDDLLKQARRLAKKIKKEGYQDIDTKIAVIGTDSIQYFVMVLRYLLDEEGIHADIYEGEYDGIRMDVMDPGSSLYRFVPDILIILPDYREIKEYPGPLESEDNVNRLLDATCETYVAYWDKLQALGDCQILQSNFVIPPERMYGNLERRLCYSKTSFLEKLNTRLLENASANVTLIDLESVAGNIGKWNWFDDTAYFLTKSAFRMDYIEDAVQPFVWQIKALRGKTKKCICLDLDNTLWGGVVGDEGFDGIQLDPNNATGEAYLDFQRYLLNLKKRGVILAIVSKNDEANAKEPFEKNPHMILHLDDIASFQANWDDKVTNIRRVAAELNIGIDSLVFFDDNPAEREIVRNYLPEVMVVDVPEDPALYKRSLDKAQPFEWLELTKEDVLRSNSYIENRHRAELQTQFADYDEYLQSLEMRGNVRRPKEAEMPRFAQLLNKSNQFNLRTQRYSEAEIVAADASEEKKCLCTLLADKFSEYGIIACVILEKQGNDCFIESWVMSCRVLKRGVENLTFNIVIETAKEWGCKSLKGQYIPSPKNGMVSHFYDDLGFEEMSDVEGVIDYSFDLRKAQEKETYINKADI